MKRPASLAVDRQTWKLRNTKCAFGATFPEFRRGKDGNGDIFKSAKIWQVLSTSGSLMVEETSCWEQFLVNL